MSQPGARKAHGDYGEKRKSNTARLFPIRHLILFRKALVSENVSAKFELRFTGRLDRELASHSRRSVTGLKQTLPQKGCPIIIHFCGNLDMPEAVQGMQKH